ncbi:putative ribonuclease H-like domain-containing protein [Tanacetum coccineum]
MVTQGYTQEEGIDYDEIFAPVAKIEAIRLLLAYASFKDFVCTRWMSRVLFFMVRLKRKSMSNLTGLSPINFPNRVYKVEKALYGLHQAPRAWYETLSTYLLDNGFQRGKINKTLFIEREKGLHVNQKKDGIFISQDKYVTEILKKFGFTDVKTASTPMETQKPLLKDEDGEEVDVHLYRSMIGSLLYLTSLRPDIMFTVCACARYQVNPKVLHFHAVKRIFRYLKGQPKLGLWYPKDSPFDLVAYTDRDYAGVSLDRKSTTGCCQFLGCRLISWQCKKHIVVANSTTKAEYVVALIKNPVFHSKIKHIGIRYHFIRNSNEKKLIQMIKIHTNENVADLLTKAFDDHLECGGMFKGNLRLRGKLKFVSFMEEFVDTHNLVMFLAKPAESKGFEQIVDFLNAHTIKYALTVNPTIYTSCIEQIWASVKVKMVNGEQQLQALMDGKKIVVTESSIRIDLQLDDEEGTHCFPNATIFEELTRIGYEKLSQKLTFYEAFFSSQWKFLVHTILQCLSANTTAWNEFSSTMASAIISLDTNQKFHFSKYIFESMMKNLDNAGKFLMYPRFIQVFLDNQLEGMSSHKRIYVTPSHTKKIFANMRRQGKDFSGRETPLFPTMVVQAQEEIGEGLVMPTDPYHTPIITQPSSSQPQRKQKSRRSKRKDTEVPHPSDPINVADKDVNEEPSMQLKELMDFYTKFQQRVLDLENTKTAQAQEITSLKLRVKKLEKKGGSRTHKLRRLYKVGEEIHDIDADEDITLENVHDAEMFDVNDLHGDEVFVEKEVPVKEVSVVGKVNTASIATTVSAATITEDEITLAQAVTELKSVKPKVTTVTTATTKEFFFKSQMKKKDQISFGEQEAIRLQAEFDEEVRLAREKDEANIALIKEWNDIQAKIETDYELAQRL